MTKIAFTMQDQRLTGFTSAGHSGYGAEGSDIVCAGISAAVQMAECTLNDVLGVGARVSVDEQNAAITLTLPKSCDEEDAAQAVLTGLMLTLCELRDEYPDYIEVMEV